MKLTDALLGEHGIIYELFAYVRETAENSDDVAQIQGAVAVLDRILLSHARIEEELLFPCLEPHLGEMGPLAVMREEHRDIENFLTAAKHKTDSGALKSLISQLLDLTHEHFQKEEGVLFAMAGQFLDEAELSEMGSDWAARRKVMLTG